MFKIPTLIAVHALRKVNRMVGGSHFQGFILHPFTYNLIWQFIHLPDHKSSESMVTMVGVASLLVKFEDALKKPRPRLGSKELSTEGLLLRFRLGFMNLFCKLAYTINLQRQLLTLLDCARKYGN